MKLRAVPDILFIPAKLAGVIAMFAASGVLFLLPWLDTSPVRSAKYRPIYKWLFWVFVADTILLGFCGANAPEGVWLILGRVATAYYFFHFLILLPVLGKLERPMELPASISEPVLKGGGGSAPPGDPGGASAAKMEKSS